MAASAHPRDQEPEILEAGDPAPRLSERWAALPRRTRTITGAAAAAVLLAAAAGQVLATRPDAPPPPPLPWPSQASHFTYLGLVDPADPTGSATPTGPTASADRDFTVALRAEATTDTPVTIDRITQGYAALSLSVSPRPPITITPGHPRRITVTMSVRRCSGLPLDARLPFLDVTLRNARAMQDFSEILGDAYAGDLSRSLRAICTPPSGTQSSTP